MAKKNESKFDGVLSSSHLVSKWDFVNPLVGWTSKQKSLTVPGRCLTLRQIADRFASGLSTLDEKVALYDEGRVVIKNFEKLDLTERMQIVKEAEASIRKRVHDQQLAAKAKHDHAFSTEVQRQVDVRIAEISKSKIDNV